MLFRSDSIKVSYNLRQAETERVAGRLAQVLVLVPKDALRYSYRFWVENANINIVHINIIRVIITIKNHAKATPTGLRTEINRMPNKITISA